MNLFIKHPRENANETWWQHCQFAIGVAIRLIFTSIMFIIHALFPFIGIPRWLNIEDTIGFLEKENEDRAWKKSRVNDTDQEQKANKIMFSANDFSLTEKNLKKKKLKRKGGL